MTKLLHPKGGSRGLSPMLRAWWAARRQKRRRRAQAPPVETPAAPVINYSEYGVNENDPERFDILIAWLPYPHGSFPVAVIEVWGYQGWGAPSFELVGSVASSPERSFIHYLAASGDDAWTYKARYRNGSVYGPFSNEWVVETSA